MQCMEMADFALPVQSLNVSEYFQLDFMYKARVCFTSHFVQNISMVYSVFLYSEILVTHRSFTLSSSLLFVPLLFVPYSLFRYSSFLYSPFLHSKLAAYSPVVNHQDFLCYWYFWLINDFLLMMPSISWT